MDTNYLHLQRGTKTPFVIELLHTKDNVYQSHSFRSITLDGQLTSPRYQTITSAQVERIMHSVSNIKILYVNKQESAVVHIVNRFNPLVYYEPNYIEDLSVHQFLMKRAFVVKVSHAAFLDTDQFDRDQVEGILIETLGSEGLLVRRRAKDDMQFFSAKAISAARDTAGAGDWFSATFLGEISRVRPDTEIKIGVADHLEKIIAKATAVASELCKYRGALGMLDVFRSKRPDNVVKSSVASCDISLTEQRLAALIRDGERNIPDRSLPLF